MEVLRVMQACAFLTPYGEQPPPTANRFARDNMPITFVSFSLPLATMSNLDPPTVLTRGPPTDSPDQPSSPAPSPSRSPSLDQETILSESTSTRPFFNGQDSRERSEDGRGRGKGKGPERRESRWRELLTEWKLLLSLENSGSVARDHLASERTFLAYARTSLTIASTGVGTSIFVYVGNCLLSVLTL